MNPRALRFRLGLFVLATLVLLAGLILLFGGFPTLFGSFHRFTVTFANAPGVEPGTPVRRSGVRIGQVQGVTLDDDTGTVLVRVLVEAQFTLRRGDQATLVHGLLGGDTSIDFLPRKEGPRAGDRTPLEEGEAIAGVDQADVGAVVDRAAGLMPPAEDALKDLGQTLRDLDRLTPRMDEAMRETTGLMKDTRAMVPDWQAMTRAARDMIPEWRAVALATSLLLPELTKLTQEWVKTAPELRRINDEARATLKSWGAVGERLDLLLRLRGDKIVSVLDKLDLTLTRAADALNDENRANLAAALKNLRTGTDRLGAIGVDAEELVKDVQLTVRRFNGTLARADDALANLQVAAKLLGAQGPSILKNLEEGSVRMNRLFTEVEDLMRCFVSRDGTLQRLMTDPTLYHRLNEAVCLIGRLLPPLEQIERDMAVFTDKIARHPEALGLGGLVRPSAGLKEAPGTPIHVTYPGH